MGEYPVRVRVGSLIHVRITISTSIIQAIMIKSSMNIFGIILHTTGECHRAIKGVLILKNNYKWRLFSGIQSFFISIFTHKKVNKVFGYNSIMIREHSERINQTAAFQ